MIQLNLLPDIKKEFIKAQRTKRTIIMIAAIASGAAIAIVILLFSAVYVVQQQRISSLDEDIQTSIDELKQIDDLDKILTIQNQLSALPGLHESKPQAIRIFDFLSIVTPNNVELTEFNVDYENNTMEITGNAVDFKAMNTFVDSLKFATYKATENKDQDPIEGEAFSEVVVDQSAKINNPKDDKSIGFTFILSYSEDIFDNRFTKVELSVPNITSSVSCQERPGDQQNCRDGNSNPFGSDDTGGGQ